MSRRYGKETGKKTRLFGLTPAACAAIFLMLLGLVPLASAASSGLFGVLPLDAFKGGFWDEPLNACNDAPPSLMWLPLCVIALAFGAALAALAKMLSGPFGQKVEAWSKEQLYQVGKSAVIVLIIFSGFLFTGMVPQNSFYGAGTFQINNAIGYAVTVRDTMIYEFTTLTTITAGLSTVGNITPYFRLGGVGVTISLSPAFRPVFDALGILMSMMGVSIGEWFVHVWMLCFIKERALAVLLPIGLFLRAFGISRAGDGLIALAIGLYFVYPFMMNVSAFAMQSYLQTQFGDGRIQSGSGGTVDSFSNCINTAGSGVGCYFKLTFGGAWNYVKAYVTDSSHWAGGLVSGVIVQVVLTGTVPGTLIVGFAMFYLLALIQSTTFYVLVVSLLLPLFNLFVTFTLIKELSAFFGTQLDFSAFEKIF
ncbi:MAG: hypothetical protein V1728_00645 [Candidatus Micrarchaeota archaeon]